MSNNYNNLRSLREDLNEFTLEQVSEATEISIDDLKLFECIDLWPDDLSKLESALSIKQLVQLANLYGVTYDKILQNSKSNLEKQAKHCYDKHCTYTDEIMKQARDNHK